jgi:acetyl-CoA acetyltransferase
MNLRDKTAIVGVGATEFSKNSGRSELRLAVECVMAALNDAGIDPREVDGMSTFTIDNNCEIEVARNIGADGLKFFSRTDYGGGGTCGTILHGMQAIASGTANVVVCYRAMNERSEYRFGQPMAMLTPTSQNTLFYYHSHHGMMTAAAYIALGIRRYMHETGTTSEDMAHLAVTSRKHASTNPNAYFYNRPITVDDYLNSRMIADPLRLLDCCQESDGGIAVVLTSAARAKSLKQKPAYLRAAAQGAPRAHMLMTNYYRDPIWGFQEVEFVARQLYEKSGLTPTNISGAVIYDHILPSLMPTLEAYGFCKTGEAKDFIKNGNIEVGGRLPLNTHGGQVGEAYIHGFNGIAEAVRQVRGTAVNQIKNVEHIVVTSGNGPPTSGLILGPG